MAVSAVSICNQALGWLGADTITSLNDETKEAQLCKDNFDELRDAVLLEREWTFAVRRLILTPLLADPVYGYEHQFLLPTDVLRALNIPTSLGTFGGLPFLAGGGGADTDQGLPDWRVENSADGNVILANVERIRLRVIWRVVNEKLWSPMFVQALAGRIAADLAMPLVNSRLLQKDMWALYEMKLAKATTMDGMQGRHEVKRSDQLINVR